MPMLGGGAVGARSFYLVVIKLFNVKERVDTVNDKWPAQRGKRECLKLDVCQVHLESLID